MLSGAGAPEAILIESDLEALCCGDPESRAEAVKVLLPEAVGVPEIAPVEALSVKPDGKDPDVIVQL